MARKPTLTVILSYAASDELDEIWQYNAEHRSVPQANSYDGFLKQSINSLATEYDEGGTLENFPEFRFLTCKKSRKGDGHYLIYEIDEAAQTVTVLHVFHTKMDVLGRLESEFQ